MTYCSPTSGNFDDYYEGKPVPTKAPVVIPDAEPPKTDGNLFNPNVPGSLVGAENANYDLAVAGTGLYLGAVKAFGGDPGALGTAYLEWNQAVAVAAFANTVYRLDEAIIVMEGVVARTNALQAFTGRLDALTAGKVQGMSANLNQGYQAIKDLRNAVLGFDSWTPENKKAWDDFEAKYLNPTLQWTSRVDSLISRGQMSYTDNGDGTFDLNVDLSDADGSLSDLVEVLAGVADAVGGLDVPWGVSGTGQVMSTWLRGGLNIWKGVLEAEQGIDDVLQAAEDFMSAGAAVLLAACEAIPALHMMLKQAVDSIWAFGKFLSELQLSFPAVNLHFKLPNLPTFDRLAKWAGIASNLNESINNALSKCTESWTATGENGDMPNMNALQDGLTGLRNARSAIETGKAGVGRTTRGLTTAGDARKAAWERTATIIGIAPATPHALPSEAAELAAVTGTTVPSGVDPDLIPDGRSAIDIASLRGKDSDPTKTAPTVPNPNQQLANRTGVASELCGTLGMSNELGKNCVEVGEAARRLGKGATEADAQHALNMILKANQAAIMSKNLALDANLENLSPAAKDYAICRAIGIQNGTILPPTNQGDMVTAVVDAFDQPTGLPNSIVQLAYSNNPQAPVSLETFSGDILNAAFPTAWFESDQRALLETYISPGVTPPDFDDLPYLLLCRSFTDKRMLDELTELSKFIESIRNNPELLASHLSVRDKAIQQGISGGSAYSWLAEGVFIMQVYSPTYTLMDIVGAFLSHRDAPDIRRLASWLGALTRIDFEVPFPSGLNSDPKVPLNEFYAAEQSFDYTQQKRFLDFAGTIQLLRTNSDLLGKQLGFDYFLAISTSMVMTRMRSEIFLAENPEVELKGLAEVAKSYTAQMQHGQELNAVLDILEAGG